MVLADEDSLRAILHIQLQINMQRQAIGLPYLLKDKQSIQQVTQPRISKKMQATL